MQSFAPLRLVPFRIAAPVFAAAMCISSGVSAQNVAGASTDLETLNQRVNEQVKRLSELRRTLDNEEAALQELRRSVGEQVLAARRGGAATSAPAVDLTPAEQVGATGRDQALASAAGPGGAEPPRRPAPIFEEPSVLTPPGGIVIEPSVQYTHSSNNRVTLLGYTIIPALLVGLIDVREVQRDTTTAALTTRFGITRRFELEARLPYLVRSDNIKSREIATGSAVDKVVGADGRGIGDAEIAARMQLTGGNGFLPLMIGSLRYKSRTGTDPFEVVTDCQQRCLGNTTGTGQPLNLPTGSGFQSVQAALTWIKASDPAVLFGTLSYLHNIPRNGVSRRVLDGERETLGRIAPGGVLGFNVGIGLALNDQSSFSVGYDQSSVARTKQNGVTVDGSTRLQLGTLLFGYSYRIDRQHSLNFSLGAGLTPDTPGVSLTLRAPWTL